MKDLLRIEWMKLRKYRTFWVMAGFFLVLLPLWNLGISEGIMKISGGTDLNLVSQAYSFSNIWQNLGYWASLFSLFICILIINISTNEIQFKTNRQNIMDGWSRLEFFHAQCLLVLTLALVATLYLFLIGNLFAFKYGAASSFPGEIVHLFYFFVLALNYFGFALLLSFFFKKSGLTISMFFLYGFVLEPLIGNIINWQTATKFGNFLPLQTSDELLPFPLMDFVKAVMNQNQYTPSDTWYVLVTFGWTIVYYLIGRKKLLNSDW